jgi:uncharacterized protein DUF4386
VEQGDPEGRGLEAGTWKGQKVAADFVVSHGEWFVSRAGITRRHARIIGLIYLFSFLTSILSDRLLRGIVVEHDAAATASHILTHQSLFRLGVAASLASTGFYLTLVALFYELFGPVNRGISLLAAFFGILGCAVQAGGSVFQSYSLAVLRTAPGESSPNPEQLPALALLPANLNDQAILVALVFFAMYDLLIGYLILRSTFLPRLFGALMVLAGVGWLTFLYEPLLRRRYSCCGCS